MKKQLQLISVCALVFVALITIVFSSCEKAGQNYSPTTFYNACDSVYCLNGGSCIDGLCNCPIGFEGKNCETRASEKFLGSYLAYDDCYKNGLETYAVTIETTYSPANILTLKGLGVHCPNDITAYISTEKSNFRIPFQKSCSNFYIYGEGNMYDNVLNVNLSLRDSLNHTTTNCSMILNR